MMHGTGRDPGSGIVRCLVAIGIALSAAVTTASLAAQLQRQAQAADADRDIVPFTLTLKTECGAGRKDAVADVPATLDGGCAGALTRLDGVVDAAPVLAGHSLTVAAEVDTTDRQAIPVQLIVMTFDDAWKPQMRRRAALTGAHGRLEARVWVPPATKHIGFTLSWTASAPSQLRIWRMTARRSERALAPGTMCAQCKAYLDNALEQVRTHFLFIDRMPMDDVANALHLAATGAANVAELDDVMKELAVRMNDAERAAGAVIHSHFLTRAEREAMSAPASGAALAAPAQVNPYFDTRLLENGVGYLGFRTFASLDRARSLAYARGLLAALTQLHGEGARRWVIDLRPHGGGNMWPTLAGLGPLLGAGDLGYMTDAAGHVMQAWDRHAVNVNIGAPLSTESPASFDATGEATAVLFGANTASSGEMVATAFRGRERTRSFGAPTCGATTGVYSVPDRYGNTLGIASTYVADRNRSKVYPRLVPDVAVSAGPYGNGDAALDAALAWLAKQPVN